MTTATADFLAVDQQAPPTVERCSDCGREDWRMCRQLCSRCYQAWRAAGRELPPGKTNPFVPIEGEQWAPLPGWGDLYRISDRGRVWSPVRGLRRQQLNPSGYWQVDLKLDGFRRTMRVHALVLEAFVGPRPEGAVTRHLNGNQVDNRLENMAWGTVSENQLDTTSHGGWPQMRRATCRLGHDLMGANLKPSKLAKGIRECWACARAKRQVRSDVDAGRTPRDLQEASDRAYAKLMGDPTT